MDDQKIAEFYEKHHDWEQIPIENIEALLEMIGVPEDVKRDRDLQLSLKLFAEHLLNDWDKTLKEIHELGSRVAREEYEKFMRNRKEKGSDV